MKIVADNKIPFLQGALEPFAKVGYLTGSSISKKDLMDADALIVRTRTKCNATLLEGTPVKFIGTATIGFDHIDTEYCKESGIYWINAPGCNSSSVQQYIGSALVYLSQKYSFKLSNKCLGIVGVGNVGAKVARLGRALGMQVLLNDPPRARRESSNQYVSLDTLIEEADIITLHVPLNIGGEDNTLQLFNEERLSRLRPDQILINTSRGEVVESVALKRSLQDKRIKAAVIDVWEKEPNIDRELLSFIDIATPHIAGYSVDGKANGTSMVVKALAKFFELPLTDWRPERVPSVEVSRIKLNGSGRDWTEVVAEAVLSTYDIEKDHRRFSSAPEEFEAQRGNYPVRREYPSYTLELFDVSEEAKKALQDLGFQSAG
jgi:erythronate-4-phosphate dehydrogenase